MTTDVTVLQNALNSGLRPMVRGPLMLVMGVVLAFVLNRELALVFVFTAPILGLVPVSYTHLDVYKRQPHAGADRRCRRGVPQTAGAA